MNIRHTYVTVLIVGGILLLTGGAVQAQLSGGSSSGGSGAGTGAMGDGRGNPDASGGGTMNQNRTYGREPSGPMDQGRQETTRPGQSGKAPLGGRTPDSMGTNPRVPGGSGTGSGSGSGSRGSSGSSGSGSGMGSSGGSSGGGY